MIDPAIFVVALTGLAQSTYEPKTWLGLVGLFVAICIPALIAATPGLISLWRNRSLPEIAAETKDAAVAVKDQVANNHLDRNLRDDIDRVIHITEATQRDIRGLRDDMGQMRGDLREERETRASADAAQARQVAAIDAAMRHLRKQLDRSAHSTHKPEGDT